MKIDIRVDWGRSSERFIVARWRRAESAPPAAWRHLAWDVGRGAPAGGDAGDIVKTRAAKFEIESCAADAAAILAGQDEPPHPLAVAAADAARDLEAWRRVEAMTTGHLALITDGEGAGKRRARAWQAVAKLAASGSRVAMRRKYQAIDKLLAEAVKAAYAPRPRRGAPAGFQIADL